MQNIDERLSSVKQRIQNACLQAGRPIESITLVGASKKQSSSLIAEFHKLGLSDVGENYLQEAVDKREELKALPLNWHFIGQIQSNKTKTIAENFRWVHGIDRLKIAKRLGQQNPQQGNPINLLVQLNPDAEASKGGVNPDQAAELCMQINEVEGVSIRGFMMIPKARDSFAEQKHVFEIAQEQLELTNQRYDLNLDSLSMGMSADLEAAIAAGSTIVRIGTDLFGARE